MSFVVGSGMQLIGKNIVSPAAATSTFSSIPQNFNHLRLILYAASADAVASRSISVNFNGNSSSIHYYQRFSGQNVTAVVTYGTAGNICYLGEVPGTTAADSSGAGRYTIDIPGYSETNFIKTIISSGGYCSSNTGQSFDFVNTGLFKTTAAITSIQFSLNSGNILANSTFFLYGII